MAGLSSSSSGTLQYKPVNGTAASDNSASHNTESTNSGTAANTAAAASASASDTLASYLQNLISQYNSTPTWQERTPEERAAQAANEYASYYGILRMNAQQNQEFQDLLLQQQKEALGFTYDKQRKASAKQYADAYSTADRQMLSRGMQRSSYSSQTLANLTQAGADAQQDIWDKQAEEEKYIETQRTLLAHQLAQQLSQYAASEANDVMNRIRALEEQDYERGLTSAQYKNQLSTQIYQFMYQMQRDQVSDSQWQAKMDYQMARDEIEDWQWQMSFNENVRQFNVKQAANGVSGSSGGSSGGGGGGGGGSSGNKNASNAGNNAGVKPTATVGGLTDNQLIAGLNGFYQANNNSAVNIPSTSAVLNAVMGTKDTAGTTAANTSIVPTKTETVSLSGPVSTEFLNTLNTMSKQKKDNKTFVSELQNAMKNK